MHRFNICLVVVLLWCENTIRVAQYDTMTLSQFYSILMEKSYCALYKLTGQVTGMHPRVEIASSQSLGHVLLFGTVDPSLARTISAPRPQCAPRAFLGRRECHTWIFFKTPTHDSLSFCSVEKHILSNLNAVIVMPRLAEQPPDFNRLISSMRRRCQACVNAGGGHTRY